MGQNPSLSYRVRLCYLFQRIIMVSRTASPRKSPTRAASPKRSPSRGKSPAKKSPAKKSPAKKRSPSKKRRSSSKKPAAHPTYKEMIKGAIMALKSRGGSSRQAIAKYISANYKVGSNINAPLRQAMRKAIASGMLIASEKHSNTFRLAPEAKKAPAAAKKKKTLKKKVAAKKPKKTVKKKKKTTPKKAKKPATKSKKKTPTKKKPAAKKPTKKS